MNINPLSIFHPLIADWFLKKLGEPTDVQKKAWHEISQGSHVLITAPTGSGKTLAAFLWAINQLVTGVYPVGKIRILYISPLKALNNDIRINLMKPLAELKNIFTAAGKEFPEIKTAVRSGDTPANERRQMKRQPPEILITTPESLNILLCSQDHKMYFSGVTAVILDEIHAVAGSKRGVYLMTAVERLILTCGEFQRIALSATVKPLEKIARMIGGYQKTGHQSDYRYHARSVSIIQGIQQKKYELQVCFPPHARENMINASWLPVLAGEFKKIIQANSSTLFFANNRRWTEKIARMINEDEATELAYSHHGSLSKEIRLSVEQKLKNGELKAIIATSSLELGIDIGDLNQVVLIQTPFSISSAVQRIGRAGHQVGETSKGLLYPTYGMDFLTAAVIAQSLMKGDIEDIRPVESPLDILAQIIISMTLTEIWDIDELYDFIKCTTAYHHLKKEHYLLLLEMLAGRYADSHIRELEPRISLDKIDHTIKAKERNRFLLFMSGGTIPDRGYYNLVVESSRSKIGELDEEFVWERDIGDTFAFGTQIWKIQRITPNDVEVLPTEEIPGIIPFWRAEQLNRDFHFSERILDFLEKADADLTGGGFEEMLMKQYYMDETAARELFFFLTLQKESTKSALPHRHHLLIEHCQDHLNKSDNKEVVLHTLWGGKVNRPFALALSAAWQEKFHYPLQVFVNNDCILLILPHRLEIKDLLTLVKPADLERLIREKLEKTSYFGAMFRENAGRALLLPRSDFKKRLPFWMTRLRSKKLLESIIAYPDFPILLETWRTCLQDEFDLDNLTQLLEELQSGIIRISEVMTLAPSPFTSSLLWQQTNKYMYEDDSPVSGKKSNLNDSLIRDLIYSSQLRLEIPPELNNALDQKLKRTAPGYAPQNTEDLIDWVKERLLIPENEWQVLLEVIDRDHGLTEKDILPGCLSKLAVIRLPESACRFIVSLENLGLIAAGFNLTIPGLKLAPLNNDPAVLSKINTIIKKLFKNTPNKDSDADTGSVAYSLEKLLPQWLSYYSAVEKQNIQALFGLNSDRFQPVLDDLITDKIIVQDHFIAGSKTIEICETENLEILLHLHRKARIPQFKPLDTAFLPLFTAHFQGLTSQGQSLEDLQDRLEALFGYPAPCGAWEEYIFPARLHPYYPAWLDTLTQTSDLIWLGMSSKNITFIFPQDIPLIKEAQSGTSSALQLFPEVRGKYDFFKLIDHTGLSSKELTAQLWNAVWRSEITNDQFQTLRKGILNHFKTEDLVSGPAMNRRAGFNRWSATRPISGNWYLIHPVDTVNLDPIEKEELNKDRIRLLFNRYGILFKELLANESPLLQWKNIFKTLRLMELSGEILSGYFFKGIPGLQFISQDAFRILRQNLPEDAVYWLNAADPASFCGIKIDKLKENLPSRLPTTYLVYHGKKLVLTAKRNGKDLTLHVDPGHSSMDQYFSFFKILLSRPFNPSKKIIIETVNAVDVKQSPYLEDFKKFGFKLTYKTLELWAYH